MRYRFIGMCALWCALVSPGWAANPQGHFDTLSNGLANGWAYDADEPDTKLQVEFFDGGPKGTGTLVDTATADQPRPDLVGLPFENHAFRHLLPASVLDRKSHAIWAHAVNVGPGADFMLINSPKLILGDDVEIWMCKGNPWGLGTSNEWEYVKHNVDVVKLYIDQVNSASITQLRNLVTMFKKYNIKIAIELAGLANWHANKLDQSAERSFLDESRKVKLLTDPVSEGGAGGTIAYLDMDGPIRRMLYPSNNEPGYHTVDSATDELVEVMQLWRERYPDIQFMLLSNFPNWGWKSGPAYNNFGYSPGPMGWGDYYPVLQMAIQKTNAAGIPLTGVTLDNPYGYAIGRHNSNQPGVIAGIDFLARLRDVEEYVEGEGLRCGIIYNSEEGGNASTGSDQKYYDETLAFIDEHLDYGATPSNYTIQSWYPYPSAYLPETTEHTMTYLTAEVIRRLRPNADPVGTPVGTFESCSWTKAKGWAADYDTEEPVDIDFYIDGLPGTGTIVGSTVANRGHGDQGPHGFNCLLNPSVMSAIAADGQPHQIYAVALNKSGPGNYKILDNSPITLSAGYQEATAAETWQDYR
jgi:hypothetical protein